MTIQSFGLTPGGILLYDVLFCLTNLIKGVMNSCLKKAGLAIATTTTKLQIVNAIEYVINGVFYAKAATDNIDLTAADEQAISTFCKYLVSIDSAGTVSTTKGNDVSSAADTKLPILPADQSAIGYIQVATDGVTTFTAGTTALDAAGITDTYVDLMAVNSGLDKVALSNK